MLTSNNSDFLFVYGTLMKSYGENPFLNEIEQYASFQTSAFTTGELYLVDYYPGFIKSEIFEFVYGELFKIHDAKSLFSALDPYEDFDPNDLENSLFLREKIEVFTDVKNPPFWAWAYIFNKPVSLFRRIESGNFLDISI